MSKIGMTAASQQRHCSLVDKEGELGREKLGAAMLPAILEHNR